MSGDWSYGRAAAWLAISHPLWFTDDGKVIHDQATQQCEWCGHSSPCPLEHDR